MNVPRADRSGFTSTIPITIVAGIVVLALGWAAGYYTYNAVKNSNTQKQVAIENVNTNASANTVVNNNVNENTNAEVNVNTNAGVDVAASRSPEIKWETPIEIKNLGVFTYNTEENYGRDADATYYKVGKFTSGTYKDGDLILVNAGANGLMFSTNHFHFIKQGEKLTLLSAESDAVKDSGLDTKKFSTDKTTKITAFSFPDTLNGPLPRQTLIRDTFARAMFNDTNLTVAFTDATFSKAYTTASVDPDAVRNVFTENGFYLRAPDGTTRVYKLVVDFVGKDSVPAITWSDNTKNEQAYDITRVGGCGSENYLDIDHGTVNRATDLTAVGTTSKNDTVYALKDTNHKILRDYYDSTYAPTVYPKDSKVSYSTYLASKPIVFFADPFDRLVKLTSQKFRPMAECGKPVIYLYPKTATRISVRLDPQGGFSYTEPAYNTGWNVLAKPDGTLTNLADGKTYPYLFWEGRGGRYVAPTRGSVVSQNDVYDFLADSLAKLGLNKKETSDFIEFWEPRMQGSPFYRVSFYGTPVMNELAPLDITPAPDTVIRILMDFKPLKAPTTIEPQLLTSIPRNGFTVIEWGGVIQ